MPAPRIPDTKPLGVKTLKEELDRLASLVQDLHIILDAVKNEQHVISDQMNTLASSSHSNGASILDLSERITLLES